MTYLYIVIDAQLVADQLVLLGPTCKALPRRLSHLPRYTREEINQMRDLNPEAIKAIHAVKKEFGGKINNVGARTIEASNEEQEEMF